MAKQNIILLNENVLCDLDVTLHKTYNERYTDSPLPPLHQFYSTSTPLISRKVRHKLYNIMLEEGFFLNLPYHTITRDMLHEMYNYEQIYPQLIHIRICTSLNPATYSIFFNGLSTDGELWSHSYIDPVALGRVMSEKVLWFEKVLGVKQLWMDRIIFIDDAQLDPQKHCIVFSDANVVIQCMLHNYKKENESQQQILYIRDELNQVDGIIKKATDIGITIVNHLKFWKKTLKLHVELDELLEEDTTTEKSHQSDNIQSFIHGSHDSSDIDRLYLFPDKLPTHKECLQFVQSSGTEDRNLFVVDYVQDKKGYVKDAFKGLTDEVNNAFLTTYSLHKQEHECPILGKINRVVPLKVCFTLLNLLIRTRHCPLFRDNVTKALRAFDFETRRQVVSQIDFTKIDAHLTDDDVKYCAFRLGQTLALIEGKEVYTKETVVSTYPKLRPHIYRDKTVSRSDLLDVLNEYTRMFLDAIADVKADKRGSLHLFQMKRDKVAKNHFHLQCNGLVIDMRDQKMLCQFYPLNHDIALSADWPQDNPHPQTTMESGCCFVHIFGYDTEKVQSKNAKKIIKNRKDKKNNSEEIDDGSNITNVTEIIVCTPDGFETPETKKITKMIQKKELSIDISKLDFRSYFHVFSYNKKKGSLQIVAMRSRLTFLLENDEVVQQANKQMHS
jgi:hypothetical protein